jgi:hypothetical protein
MPSESEVRAPAQSGKAADIEQFARRAVRPRRVEADRAGVSDGFGTTRTSSDVRVVSAVGGIAEVAVRGRQGSF